ncbi:MAG: hypothetical protein OXF88_22895 [Rhodobacteraceae bacterium]|nr:hypothetical protein [Paracoccaceae bacterium]MCY4140369.1 hypothetical protein [Paracoccaceae bacterium]
MAIIWLLVNDIFFADRIGTAVQLEITSRLSFVLAGCPSSEYADREQPVKSIWQADFRPRRPGGAYRAARRHHSAFPMAAIAFCLPERVTPVQGTRMTRTMQSHRRASFRPSELPFAALRPKVFPESGIA